MKMDQIAFYCADKASEDRCKLALGLSDATWIEDQVTAKSIVVKGSGKQLEEATNTAILKFNYDLGIEVEILRYVSGPHWHQSNSIFLESDAGEYFQSHIGFHLGDNEDFPDAPQHLQLVQMTKTIAHTNAFLTDPTSRGFGRKYEYKIYATPTPGLYFKYIKRINPKQEGAA
jgi:hypothetical protein